MAIQLVSSAFAAIVLQKQLLDKTTLLFKDALQMSGRITLSG